MTEELRSVLAQACQAARLDARDAEVVRLGENAIYRLRGGVIARIARPGQEAAARREVAVSRWLNASGVPAVTALAQFDQPIEVDGRAVTFWEELPAHQQGKPAQVATALKALHALPVPADLPLGQLDPFVRLPERIAAAATLAIDDRDWLSARVAELSAQWNTLLPDTNTCVVHGDAWAGNVVVTENGQISLLDLERCSVGPPEWDLVSTAVKYVTYSGISRREYDEFVEAYGRDVTTWEHFEPLRDMRELRMTCYVAQHAAGNKDFAREADLRVRSLRGQNGQRPWQWTPAE